MITKKTFKLHLGAGHEIKKGWINHDLVDLPGIDKTFDLDNFPWPIESNSVNEVYAANILEHLPNTIKVMEEIYRITIPGAKVYISVPYWNSWEAVTDPTHKTQFNEFTFEFFDPNCWRCQDRPYYSFARFNIVKIGFGVMLIPHYFLPKFKMFGKVRAPLGRLPFFHWMEFYHPIPKWFFGLLASFLNNIIIGLEVYLERCD